MLKRCLSTVTVTQLVKLLEPKSAGVIQLNRPKAFNAIKLEMFDTIHQLLQDLERDKDVVIFKGSGKVFCAGGDLKQISNATEAGVMSGFANVFKSANLIVDYKKPYVALMDGLAMGIAAVYTIPGKHCVATENTIFAMPETSIGYFTGGGATYFLPRIDNCFGIYMGLTGARVNGFDMKKLGLASHYVESHKLDELEEALVTCKTNEDVCRILKEFSSDPTSTVTELDQFLPKTKKCFGGETIEKIYENLQEDGSDWAQNTLKILNRMSPISLKVVHRSLLEGKMLSFQDCLKMEFSMLYHHCVKSDFKEGARALFEKNGKPKWSHKNIYDVSEDDVARFFRPVPEEHLL